MHSLNAAALGHLVAREGTPDAGGRLRLVGSVNVTNPHPARSTRPVASASANPGTADRHVRGRSRATLSLPVSLKR